MNYRVQFRDPPKSIVTVTTGVLWYPAVEARVRQAFTKEAKRAGQPAPTGWTYAVVGSPGLRFFSTGFPTIDATIYATLQSLEAAVLGAPVLVDDGTGKYRLGSIIGDADLVLVDGVEVAGTGRAALLADTDQGKLVAGTKYKLLEASAFDNSRWFALDGDEDSTPALRTLPISVVASVGTGVLALVEGVVDSGVFVVVSL